MNIDKILVKEFLEAFEDVFHNDWEYTKENLGIKTDKTVDENAIYFIHPTGTFLNPKVDDETENWGNRAKLLDLYRKLTGKR